MKKDDTKNKKYPPKRIPIKYLRKLEQIGEGDWRHGLTITVSSYEKYERNPCDILFKEIEHFGAVVSQHFSENHLEHYVESGLPVLLRKFAKTGQVDKDILWQKRKEKPIDEFQNKQLRYQINQDMLLNQKKS